MNSVTSHIRPEPGDRSLQLRAGMLCFGVVVFFSLLSWRLIHLQYGQHGKFLEVTESSRHRQDVIHASRGEILDTRGRLLACDEPVQQVSFELKHVQVGADLAEYLSEVEGMKPGDLQHVYSLEELQNRYLKHLAVRVAPELDLGQEEFISKIKSRMALRNSGEIMLTKKMSVSAAMRLRASLTEAKLGKFRNSSGRQGALIFTNSYARRYPADVPLTHIVGLFGETLPERGEEPKPPSGVAGVERYFDKELTGIPGLREKEVDGWGNEIPAYRGRVIPPQNGKNLKLSLDLGLQAIVDQTLAETGPDGDEVYAGDLKAERVIVVLFDPETMGVRAIGCHDTDFGSKRPLLTNPATEMSYEPGSTIKIVTVASALSSGKVHPGTRINLGSGGKWDDPDITPITDLHVASSLTVEEILVHSSNIGAYKLGRMLGTRRFEEIFREFGFSRLTGFETPMESRGAFAQPMNFQTLSRMAFGNAITVTPAQMCGALGTIINDGLHSPLHLAESWVDEEGEPIPGLERPEPKRVITAAAAKSVREAMLKVVEIGTGKKARSELFSIAGKTGTARKATTILKDGKERTVYLPGDYICSFVGFVPADKPRLGGIVIVDNPRGTKFSPFGGSTAAPLFRRLAERAMAYYQVPAQFSPEVRLLPQSARTVPVRGLPATHSR